MSAEVATCSWLSVVYVGAGKLFGIETVYINNLK